jgi:hypothetical protein
VLRQEVQEGLVARAERPGWQWKRRAPRRMSTIKMVAGHSEGLFAQDVVGFKLFIV